MAGLAHLGVGLAAKQLAPTVNAGALVAASYAIDLIWAGFWAAGVEYFPDPIVVRTAPWSHGLLMASLWSLLIGLAALRISRNRRTGLVIGLLVFSHWVVDFVAKPMTYTFPADGGLPLLFDGSQTVGLGVWGTAPGVWIGEYGTTLVGLVLYLLAKRRSRLQALAGAGVAG